MNLKGLLECSQNEGKWKEETQRGSLKAIFIESKVEVKINEEDL